MANNFIDIRLFTAQLKDLNNQFYVLLDEMVQNYPSSRTSSVGTGTAGTGTGTSSVGTGTSAYNENQFAMKKLQNQYFLFKNTVIQESDRMSSFGKKIELQMEKLDEDNEILKNKFESLKGSDGSAAGLLDDTQLTRNQLVFGNVILALCMLVGGYLYYNKSTTPSTITDKIVGAVTGAAGAVAGAAGAVAGAVGEKKK
jgi:hypothetical protein